MAAVITWLINRHTARKATAVKTLVYSSVALGCALVGLLINATVLQSCFAFRNFAADLNWRNWSLTRLWDALMALVTTLGWHEGAIFGVATLGNVVTVLILVLLIVAVVDILRHRERYADGVVTLTWFMVSGVVVFMGIYLTTTMPCDMRFALPVTVFFLPVSAFYLSANWQYRIVVGQWQRYVKPSLAVVAVTLVLFNGLLLSSQFYFANAYPYHNATENTSLRTIGQQLLDAGVNQGYYLGATENRAGGNTLTEMTNGALEVWHLTDDASSLADIYPWLQPTAHARTHPTGAVFVVIGHDHRTAPLAQKLYGVQAGDYSDNNFTVWIYDNYDTLAAVVNRVDAVAEVCL